MTRVYPEDIALYDTFVVTADVGWIAGGTVDLNGGVILHTRDGEHWVLSGTIRDTYQGYMFTSETRGVYLGPNGDLHRTDNGGRSWQQAFQCAARVEVNGLTRTAQCNWQRLQFVTPTVGYAVADSYDARCDLPREDR